MSVEAVAWALKQPVKHSSAKFVLVALANCANGHSFECWPSVAYLCEATAQNRKTVIGNIGRLIEDGYIKDTGDRKGRTGGIKTYRLNTGASHEKDVRSSPKNGTAKQSQKRNSTENGTVPKTDGSSTENGHEAVPKTGHGTVSEPEGTGIVSAPAGATSLSVAASKKKSPVTFEGFCESIKASGGKPISPDDPIFEWADAAGIPDEWLALAWSEFKTRYRGNGKRYADWRAVFRTAIRNNWFKFWRISQDGQYVLTTEGEMARRAGRVAA